jgi:hypothetical protein
MKKNLYIVLFVSFLFGAFPAECQIFHWAQRSICAVGTQSISSHVTDRHGNLFIAGGASRSSFDPDIVLTLDSITITSATGFAFIAKYNAAGRILWLKKLPAIGDVRLAIDKNGNVYMCGFYYSTPITLGAHTVYPRDAVMGNGNTVIAKMDQNGDFLWAQSAGHEGYNVMPNAIGADDEGNVAVGGYFNGPGIKFGSVLKTPQGNGFVVKYSTTGSMMWVQGLGCGTASDAMGTQARGVDFDLEGNVLVGGDFYADDACFGSVSLHNLSGSCNVFVAKYSASGLPLWAKAIGGTGWEQVEGMTVDRSGNVYIAGASASATIRVDGIPMANPGSHINLLVASFDKNGKSRWAKTMGGGGCTSGGMAIAINDFYQLYLLGYISDHPYGTNGIVDEGNGKVLLLMDTSGVVRCGYERNENSSSSGWVNLSLDNTGYAVVSGYYNSEALAIQSHSLPATGSANYFIAKFSCGPLNPTDIKDAGPVNTYSVHPNPATDVLLVEGIEAEVAYELVDIYGRVIAVGKLTDQRNALELNSAVSQGIYMLRLTGQDGNTSAIKVVKP